MKVEERVHLSHTQIGVLLLSELQFTEHQENMKLTPIEVRPLGEPTGPRVNIPSLVKGMFFLFFKSTFLEHILVESDRYAAHSKGEFFENWQPITEQELCGYIGFMILIVIIRLPRFDEYWRKDAIYHYSPVACYKYKHECRSTVWYFSDCGHHFCHTGHQDSDCFCKYHLGFSAGQQTANVSKYNCMALTSIGIDCIDIFNFISASLLTQLHSYLHQSNKV